MAVEKGFFPFVAKRVVPLNLRLLVLLGFSGVALAACQPSGGTASSLLAPEIGDLPGATHQDRVTLFGTKTSGTAIYVNGVRRVLPDDGTTWAAAVDLTEGLNAFIVESMDDLGNLSDPLPISITLDTAPPSAPTVSYAPSASLNPVTISGTKEPGTFIRLNGRRISLLSDETDWEYQVTLSPGDNTLTLTAVDEAGNESAAIAPAPVIALTAPSCDAPPRPLAPLDGRAIPWGHAFSWTHAPATYVFELSASPAFESPLEHQATIPGALEYLPLGLAPSNGVYYWRVGAVDTCGTSYGPPRKVIVGSMTGDVTGDGFADVFVGANADGLAGDLAGATYLYNGGATSDVTSDALMTGRRPGDTFGSSVAKAGDIDRDGYVDLLVGAPTADRDSDADDNTGAAYLYWGAPDPENTPALVFRGEAAGSLFGMSVASLGDVNGDEYPDIAVGAYQMSVRTECGGVAQQVPFVGRVYVFFGGPREQMDNRADVVLTGETTEIPEDPSSACRPGDEFGLSVAGAGDVNGDGYGDIAVGARGFDGSLSPLSTPNTGRAYVFFGGPWFVGVGAERADVVLTGSAADDRFGAAVAGAGDTNGDGFADLVVGAHLSDANGTDAGAVSWYFGRSTGVAPAPVQISGAVASDNFGASVAPLGDINRDGFADFVVGAYLVGAAPNDNGAASFYLGNAAGTVTPAGTIFGETTPNPDDQFGLAVGGAGDVDGDGFDDAVVGATRHDVCAAPAPFCFNAGRAYVIMGPTITTRGAAANPQDRLLTGRTSGDSLGSAVN